MFSLISAIKMALIFSERDNKVKNFIASIIIFALPIVSISGCKSESESEQQKTLRIVCFGDSLTVCGGEGGRYSDWLAQSLPQHKIINKGVNGDTLQTARKRFPQDVLGSSPDIVIIELGANDMWQMKRPIDDIRNDLEHMVKSCRENDIEVVIASCFGNRDYTKEPNVEFDTAHQLFATQIWKIEEQICKKYECFYVPNMQVDIKPNGTPPYWGDNNHPNKEGNRLVAQQILKVLEPVVQSRMKKQIKIFSNIKIDAKSF